MWCGGSASYGTAHVSKRAGWKSIPRSGVVLPGRATGLFILDESYLIKEYWLHEWNQVMINRVLRASHISEPVMGFVHRLEKGKHQ